MIDFTPFLHLSTKRLSLRQFRHEDESEIFFMRSDKGVLEFIDIPVAKDRSAKNVNNISIDTIGYYTEFSAKFYTSKNGTDYVPVSGFIPNSNNVSD